ncbi:retrovirus-related Pol polyprotein from transposon 17.6 [Trichonephila clavipes]|nr:retrovirus-related Pol polyprotein from transposon 17.6 [Trichonephila clavipes]
MIKRKTPINIKEHFLDIWVDLNDPLELAKLDAYESLRPGMKSNPNQTFKKKEEFRKPFPIKNESGCLPLTTNVADIDQDKTAFICPFGTYRYLLMPFGLRKAPATFQRLIDKFRSGLKDVFALSHLDDIIVLSEAFEKHLEDLKNVFERPSIFKLHANRDKCHLSPDRVKYLGFWITKDGIEADKEKISAI